MSQELSGIALRDVVFDEQNPLPGKVFGIELLQSPVWLKRRGGRLCVSISRAGVELAVYTNPGRQRLADLTFTGQSEAKEVQKLDEEIHRILLGKQNPQTFQLKQPNLRSASGGVLSRVEYRERSWFTFFFRDIAPYGWNICLGASEHDDELTDPWKFGMREFLEETLICQPTSGPQTIRRPLVDTRLDIKTEIKRAERLSAKHKQLRRDRDGINF